MPTKIAILLSGGKGSRLGKLTRDLPKPLIHIGDEPVINKVVDKFLRVIDADGKHAIRRVYVLLRKKQSLEPTNYDSGRLLNLQEHFAVWERIYYGSESDRVKIIYEEELDSRNEVKGEGAIAGLLRFLRAAKNDDKLMETGERVIVAAADNYFPDDDLREFCLFSSSKITINGYKDLVDPEKIRDKFGCILFEQDWISSFEEKPETVSEKHHIASVGLYNFSHRHFMFLEDYAKTNASLGAPGKFLEWLAQKFPRETGRMRTEGVKGYAVKGHWFDIGNPTDLKIALFWYTHDVLGQLKNVEDLIVARATNRVDDNSYLICRNISISHAKRTIRFFFKINDELCSLRTDFRKLGTIKEITEQASAAETENFWKKITSALEDEDGANFKWYDLPNCVPPSELDIPLLLSGGVFLFDNDRTVDGKLPRNRAIIPFLEKDHAARTDPRRVTTAAGRMNDLDFQQVCADELLKELVFFGREKDTYKTRIYCPHFHSDRRRELLECLLKNRIHIPGITGEEIEVELDRDEQNFDLIFNVPVEVIIPPADLRWKVEVYLGREDERGQKVDYKKIYVRENFLVIPDSENNILEIRLLCAANIMGSDRVNETRKQVGRIRGIADGDGFGRAPLLIKAAELERYYSWLTSEKQGKKDILKLLNRSQHEEVELWAVGDGMSGQFSRFKARMPTLFLTSSVEYLAKNLSHLLE